MDITTALRDRGVGVGKKLVGNAQAGDVRAGKTFSNANGNNNVGTLPVRQTGPYSVTPGVTPITLASGIYDGDISVAGDSDLIAANIKSGVNIFGVLGTAPIPVGTAVAADVLTGKTFSNGSATNVAGTMANNGAVTITPGTTDQTIAVGYHNGLGKVVGDPDLIAANILTGKNIFGVAGSLILGKKFASGTTTTSPAGDITVNGLSFTPRLIIVQWFPTGIEWEKTYNDYDGVATNRMSRFEHYASVPSGGYQYFESGSWSIASGFFSTTTTAIGGNVAGINWWAVGD